MKTQQALEVAKTLARMAAERILLYYGDTIDIDTKDDDSPVTVADREADEQILRGLRQAYPDHAYLTEESVDTDDRLSSKYVWVVDPLDGTKEFLKENGEFTVNIALLENGLPILGAIAVPAQNMLYWGGKGLGAFRRRGRDDIEEITVSQEKDPSQMIVVRSKSHPKPEDEAFVEQAGIGKDIQAGSSAKGCKVAEGTAHVYPRFGRQMEWDICAMAAIIEAAGGTITDLKGKQLTWNKQLPEVLGFLASNGTIHDELIQVAEAVQ